MEELLQKIKEHTSQGSPSVGQLIELNDLAKKAGVKRNELEKLITESVAKQKLDDFERKSPLSSSTDFTDSSRTIEPQRPVFEDRRDIFERKIEEDRNFDSSSFGTSTFEKKEVSYDEINKNFENASKTGVKSSHYPDSKEREKELLEEKNKQQNAALTVEQKLALVSKELQLAVNARKIQGLPAYTEQQFFDLTNIFRKKYGLHKLEEPIIVEKEEPIVQKEEEETTPIQVELNEEMEAETINIQQPSKKEAELSYDKKIGEIKKELQNINASNFFNNYAVKAEEYIALHNTLFEKYGLPKIKSLEECIIPLPELSISKNFSPKKETKTPPTQEKSNYTQSQEEIERQLNIVKKKEAEKQAEFEKKERIKKQLEELNTLERSRQMVINDLKSTRVMAFVALGLSLFIVPIAGVILGGITMIRLGEFKKKLQDVGLAQNKETETIFNVARFVSIGAFAIGAFKMLKWIMGM